MGMTLARGVLAELDEAVDQKTPADHLIAELAAIDPGPTTHLMSAATRAAIDIAEHVARFYPY